MNGSVIDTLYTYLPKERIGVELSASLKNFRLRWGNKDEIHRNFLNSNLLGVYPVRFSDIDEDLLFADIFNIDSTSLQQDYYRTPGINKSFKVSSNVTNLTLVCLMSIYINSKLNKMVIESTCNDLFHIFCYKILGSIFSHYFKYDVNINTAKSLYEQLTDKYLIKKAGTWEATFDAMYKSLFNASGPTMQKLKKGDTDSIVKVVNDMQNRLKDMIKGLYKILIKIKENDEDVITTTNLIAAHTSDEGTDQEFKEQLSTYNHYILYIKNIINHKNDFINDDIVYLVKNNFKLNNDYLETTLEYISLNDLSIKDNEDYISFILEGSFQYLRRNGITTDYLKKLEQCMKLLTGFYKASKVKDQNVVTSKKIIFNKVKEAINKNTDWIIQPVVLGVFMYIFIRAVVK